MNFIDRASYRRQIEDSLARFRVTALLGPRQGGKTTLARAFATPPDAYFDLEDPLDLARLEAPRQTLGRLTGLVHPGRSDSRAGAAECRRAGQSSAWRVG